MTGSDRAGGGGTAEPTYLLGWNVTPGPHMGLLRIRTALGLEDLERGGAPLTMLLTASQAGMLGDDLRKLSKQIAGEDVGTRQ